MCMYGHEISNFLIVQLRSISNYITYSSSRCYRGHQYVLLLLLRNINQLEKSRVYIITDYIKMTEYISVLYNTLSITICIIYCIQCSVTTNT